MKINEILGYGWLIISSSIMIFLFVNYNIPTKLIGEYGTIVDKQFLTSTKMGAYYPTAKCQFLFDNGRIETFADYHCNFKIGNRIGEYKKILYDGVKEVNSTK